MNAINLFGLGAVLVGLGGLGTAVLASREAVALARTGQYSAGGTIIGAMIFIALVDLMIVVLGTWITLLDATIMSVGSNHG